jgi:hypothetical protein
MEQFDTHSSETWNVAQGYTALKILKPLAEMDKLVKIAIYGAENIEESLFLDSQTKVVARIEAMSRLIDSLRETIENSDFSMFKGKTKEDLQELADAVEVVAQYKDSLKKETSDTRTGVQTIEIQEKLFSECLKELRRIKQAIPKPLNENGLIFPNSDEVDLDMIKKQIIESG